MKRNARPSRRGGGAAAACVRRSLQGLTEFFRKLDKDKLYLIQVAFWLSCGSSYDDFDRCKTVELCGKPLTLSCDLRMPVTQPTCRYQSPPATGRHTPHSPSKSAFPPPLSHRYTRPIQHTSRPPSGPSTSRQQHVSQTEPKQLINGHFLCVSTPL